ncbi:MAG: hypothetical protein JW969_11000 [Spirochaetales bacterium]|nr:hypothetical protein [Spirochaetales bacterium]
MSDIKKLNHDEKVFLAGCIKYMITVDGKIQDEELTEIPDLFPNVPFDDFESCLNEFELKVKDMDDLWDMAEEIKFETPRDIILRCLYDVALLDGMPAKEEMKFFKELSRVWKDKELL